MISLNVQQHEQQQQQQQPSCHLQQHQVLLQQCDHLTHSRADDSELDNLFSIPLIVGDQTADCAFFRLGPESPSLMDCHRSQRHSGSEGSDTAFNIKHNPIKLEDSGWSDDSLWQQPQQQLPQPPPLIFQQQQQQLQQLSRSISNFTTQSSVDSSISCPPSMDLPFTDCGHVGDSRMEVDGELAEKSANNLAGWKPNHSEVEKMRRDKMNGYIQDMANLVPLCRSASRKLDKLTVLRMAAQHLKTLRLKSRLSESGDSASRGGGVGADPISQLFSAQELQRIIQNNFDGFVLVIGCDRARILYASKGPAEMQSKEFSPRDLIGHNLLDVVHPKDVSLVKEQLAFSDSFLNLRLQIDSANALRRHFYCRIRTDIGSNSRRRGVVRHYEHLHCSGFVHWPAAPSATAASSSSSTVDFKPAARAKVAAAAAAAAAAASVEEAEPQPVGQLVLLCRPALSADSAASLPARARPEASASQFHARLTLEGRISWVEQRVTPLLGHLPQDLLDTSLYDLVSREDLHRLSVAHASALKSDRSRVTLQQCRLHSGWASGESAVCSLSLQCFANPLTQSPEFLSLTGTLADAGQRRLFRQCSHNCEDSTAVGKSTPVANEASGWHVIGQLAGSIGDNESTATAMTANGVVDESYNRDGLADCGVPWPLV